MVDMRLEQCHVVAVGHGLTGVTFNQIAAHLTDVKAAVQINMVTIINILGPLTELGLIVLTVGMTTATG